MPFTCKLCGEQIPFIRELNRHRWDQHRERMLAQTAAARAKRHQKDQGASQSELVPKDGKGAPVTANVSETALLRMVTQSQVVVMTPDIYISYMCALKQGFENNLTEFLSIVARDFWEGRGIDPYKEVSGIAEKEG